MEIAPEVLEIEQEAARAAVPMSDVLRRADVAATTWGRWVQGKFEPRVSTLRKVKAALTAAIQEKAA